MADNKIASMFLRGIAGAFILNTGIGKMNLPKEGAEYIHGMAVSGIPAVKNIDPQLFAKVISASEIGIGASLLLPVVPNKLAGLMLGTFSSGLLSMYFGEESNTEKDGIRPSQSGLPLAKDSWLFAIAGALLTMKK
ncbi:hypothetical protein [Corynebacterium rouxii]|uniref:DoxX family membrane protein n=1 Tax=Corynebacterium rouxii TaxID=2719119 RepID=A0A6I8MDD9_9CORY|nr:hypothetical protein [Corynebacterium rouxii]MDT9409254.1 hypothetical protein [Corynebacterium rouxii]MDT9411487.1 hypothetical protein [Corynebacterium rouxii]VZH85761.1 hypothetical protein FRC0190_01698 [Corynebacterium rouxii]